MRPVVLLLDPRSRISQHDLCLLRGQIALKARRTSGLECYRRCTPKRRQLNKDGEEEQLSIHSVTSNDIEFSGERKRVRCNEGLGRGLPGLTRRWETTCRWKRLSLTQILSYGLRD